MNFEHPYRYSSTFEVHIPQHYRAIYMKLFAPMLLLLGCVWNVSFFIIVAQTVGPLDRSSEKNLINEAILSLKLSFPPPLPFVQYSNTNNNTGRYLFPARLSSRPAHLRKKNTRNSHHIPSIAWLHKFKFMITVNAQFPADAGLGSRPRDDGDAAVEQTLLTLVNHWNFRLYGHQLPDSLNCFQWKTKREIRKL